MSYLVSMGLGRTRRNVCGSQGAACDPSPGFASDDALTAQVLHFGGNALDAGTAVDHDEAFGAEVGENHVTEFSVVSGRVGGVIAEGGSDAGQKNFGFG